MKNKAARTIPDDFALTADDIWFFEARNPKKDLKEQFERFKAYHQARGNKFVNWDAAWRTWAMNAAKFEPDHKFDESKLRHPLFVPPTR